MEPLCSIHIAWSRMDEKSVSVRIDPFEGTPEVQYRLSMDGGPWALPDGDRYYSFPAEAGTHLIACECQMDGGWANACEPVTVNFIPTRQRPQMMALLSVADHPVGGLAPRDLPKFEPTLVEGKRVM